MNIRKVGVVFLMMMLSITTVFAQKTVEQMTNVRPIPPYIPQYAAHYMYEQHNTYSNIKETVQQMGGTAEIGVVINHSWNFRLFGTLQRTNLKNHDGYTGDRTNQIARTLGADTTIDWTTDDVEYKWTQVTDSLVDGRSKSTPSFFGGFELNWLPTDKWTFTSTGYGFSKQTYIHQYGYFDIKPKMLVNLRVAYKFTRNSSVFMTVNNIFDSTSQEFGFMDKTGALWFWGVNVKF